MPDEPNRSTSIRFETHRAYGLLVIPVQAGGERLLTMFINSSAALCGVGASILEELQVQELIVPAMDSSQTFFLRDVRVGGTLRRSLS